MTDPLTKEAHTAGPEIKPVSEYTAQECASRLYHLANKAVPGAEWIHNSASKLFRRSANLLSQDDTHLREQVARLTERCAAYKGQVEAGAIEIESLRSVHAAMLAALKEALGALGGRGKCCYGGPCIRTGTEHRDDACKLRDVRDHLEAAARAAISDQGEKK